MENAIPEPPPPPTGMWTRLRPSRSFPGLPEEPQQRDPALASVEAMQELLAALLLVTAEGGQQQEPQVQRGEKRGGERAWGRGPSVQRSWAEALHSPFDLSQHTFDLCPLQPRECIPRSPEER